MNGELYRLRLRCSGAVQGVGFRPFVYGLATSLGLTGWVRNDPDGVLIEIQGKPEAVENFASCLPAALPPLARLDAFERSPTAPVGDESVFRVEHSASGRRRRALIPPDAALCGDCRREMSEPADRRYRYAFTGCASCGPRFSLVRSLPYDRARTSMSCFELCPECAREYSNPADRRFHTEPLCCPRCGPALWYMRPEGSRIGKAADALDAAVAALQRGDVVAVKGLGGYQLACRADSDEALGKLRERKRRPFRPFALMVADLKAARRLIDIGPEEEMLLSGARGPVLVAPRRADSGISDAVAPGISDLGLMLPTTPLHVELFARGAPPVLVMTSGNLSKEPICTGNREALRKLSGIADAFLMHDRDILRRVDDSVVRTGSRGPILLRRARGWVPEPVRLVGSVPDAILAVGGHLQVTACLVNGDQAIASQHVGDLETEAARGFLREVIEGLEDFLQIRAPLIAADLHPDYGSTMLARELAAERGARVIGVQHHLAHFAAVLGEHGILPAPEPRAVGIILDGTGWGGDGKAWGGEWLVLSGSLEWERAAHIGAFPLVGGELAVREPWRVVVAVLERAGAGELLPRLPMAAMLDPTLLEGLRHLSRQEGWPEGCGAGRLFEAAGAICGLAAFNTYEGEAAARLEAAAASSLPVESWPEVDVDDLGNFAPQLLQAAARRIVGGQPTEKVARGFHETFAAAAAGVALGLRPDPDTPVALGGGCFVNRLLLESTCRRLEEAGARVLLPRSFPPGDGGLSFGQAVWAATVALRENEKDQ